MGTSLMLFFADYLAACAYCCCYFSEDLQKGHHCCFSFPGNMVLHRNSLPEFFLANLSFSPAYHGCKEEGTCRCMWNSIIDSIILKLMGRQSNARTRLVLPKFVIRLSLENVVEVG